MQSRQSVTGALEKTTSVHNANEPHVQALHLPADASHEEIQEALNKLVRKKSQYIDFQGKSILMMTTQSSTQKSDNILDQISRGHHSS